MSEIDTDQQVANEVESTEPLVNTQTDSETQVAQPEQSSAPQDKEQTPFHEHPRFKELIDSNRTYKEQLSSYEQRMEAMQRQFQEQITRMQPAPQKEINPFVSKLKEIDPRYAEWAEQLEARATKAEAVERDLQEFKRERLVSNYESSVEKLHAEHKISDELKPYVKAHLDALAVSGQLKELSQVPEIYKKVAERYQQLVSNVERATTAKYTQAKKADNKTPASQPKGKAPTSRNEKGQFTGDREADSALIAKRVMEVVRAERDT